MASTSTASASASSTSTSADPTATEKPVQPRRSSTASPSVQLSKALAYLLRHGAVKESLPITPDGYISVTCLLARPRIRQIDMEPDNADFTKDGKKKLRRVTVQDIREAVEGRDGDQKKRFELREDEQTRETFVRAVQGHSLEAVTDLDHTILTFDNLGLLDLKQGASRGEAEEDEGLTSASSSREATIPASLPADVEILHGTTLDAWQRIKASGGLSKMKRNHIHLARGRPGVQGVGSGMRPTSPVLIHIDMISAMRNGITFHLASNGAVLTAGEDNKGILPLKYIAKVEERKTGQVIWTNGG